MPTVPAGSDDVVTDTGGGLIVRESDAVADPAALSVARTVKLLDPATFGVPEMAPLAERLSPRVGIHPPTTTYTAAIRPTLRVIANTLRRRCRPPVTMSLRRPAAD